MEVKRKDKAKGGFFQFRVSEDDRAILNELAEENELTVSDLIIRMARYFQREGLKLTFVPKDQSLASSIEVTG